MAILPDNCHPSSYFLFAVTAFHVHFPGSTKGKCPGAFYWGCVHEAIFRRGRKTHLRAGLAACQLLSESNDPRACRDIVVVPSHGHQRSEQVLSHVFYLMMVRVVVLLQLNLCYVDCLSSRSETTSEFPVTRSVLLGKLCNYVFQVILKQFIGNCIVDKNQNI